MLCSMEPMVLPLKNIASLALGLIKEIATSFFPSFDSRDFFFPCNKSLLFTRKWSNSVIDAFYT